MENKRKDAEKITVAILALLLLSSLAMLLNSNSNTAIAQDYGDIMQYEWRMLGGNGGGWQCYSDGPAPNTPNVIWTKQVNRLSSSAAVPGLSATVSVFNGKAFVTVARGENLVYAFDAFTGEQLWVTELYNPQTAPTKIDDTYLFVDHDSGQAGLAYAPTKTVLNGTVTVLRISDGSFVSDFTIPGVAYQPGAGGYFPGCYDPELRMKYMRGYDYTTNERSYYAIDLSDPTNPTLGWKTVYTESSELLAAGAGMLLCGTTHGAVFALNGTTGELAWRSRKIGLAQYSATYIDGMFIQGAASTTLTAYDALTGEILWDSDQGGRAFFSFAGAAGYGRYYMHNVLVPEGFVGCYDLETGSLLWKQPSIHNFGYIAPAVADGKVFIQTVDQYASGYQRTFSCFDALTGEKLWDLPNFSIMNPSIAYGNLYGINGDVIYCFSEQNPEDWAMWRGNSDTPGIIQATGPSDLSTYTWAFDTEGTLWSSPAVVDGKVYFGSQDKTWYCLDAYTGSKIWTFPSQYWIYSSPAVVGGRVYTGADDGNIYCLDADSGEEIWTKFLTSETDFEMAATWQTRSSPIIVGGNIYVGALDGKVYCIRASDGNVRWSFDTGRPILGSAAYADGVVYIGSTNHRLYALEASTGEEIWSYLSWERIDRAYTDWFPYSTPVVAEDMGMVFWGSAPVYRFRGMTFFALNITDGTEVWRRTMGGNTPPHAGPVYLPVPITIAVPGPDIQYTLHAIIIPEQMGAKVLNASDGEEIFYQWLGHEVYTSIAYANDVRTPRFYVGSNTYSVTCINATAAFLNDIDNAVMGVYTTRASVQGSPSVWNGRLYVPSTDGTLYMFEDRASADFSITAAGNKGSQMWNTETLLIEGKLHPVLTDDIYGSYPENGLPDATVKLSLTKPDGTDTSMETTTDANGYFSFSYSPTEVGEWGWVVYYEGEEKRWISYNEAYSEWNAFSVTSPPSSSPNNGNGGEEPPPAVIPMEYVYAAIAVIIIAVVAFLAYFFLKKK